ncbi:MAG: hypothetical protein ACLUHE_08450 [Christensenellales bacterium]
MPPAGALSLPAWLPAGQDAPWNQGGGGGRAVNGDYQRDGRLARQERTGETREIISELGERVREAWGL